MLTLKESIVLGEARDPKLKYTEKQVKGAIDRVTVELEKQRSSAMTRLAARYHRLDQALKRMQEARDNVNQEMKETVQGLFDASDMVYTRVVETTSFTLTLAKQLQTTPETKITYDYQKIAEELAKLIPDELQAKVDEITESCKKVSISPPKSPSFTVKPKPDAEFNKKGKLKEQLDEGVIDIVKKSAMVIKALVKTIASWSVAYDKKLTQLKKEAGI